VKHIVNEELISSYEIPILIFKMVLLKSVSIFIMILDHNEGILKDWKAWLVMKIVFKTESNVDYIYEIIKLRSMELKASYQLDWWKAITPIWLGDDCDVHN
jgi:hypothetical protein